MAAELEGVGIRVMALGSAAVVLRSGQRGTVTKDLDVHLFPVRDEDILGFSDDVETAIERLGGNVRWEPDGASMTAHVPVSTGSLPIEIILGREDFIAPDVLADAAATAEERDGLFVPSWEHIVVMKAEAWFDRTGPERRKYLEDLNSLREWIDAQDQRVRRRELHRLVDMRPERKRRDLLLMIERTFVDLLR